MIFIFNIFNGLFLIHEINGEFHCQTTYLKNHSQFQHFNFNELIIMKNSFPENVDSFSWWKILWQWFFANKCKTFIKISRKCKARNSSFLIFRYELFSQNFHEFSSNYSILITWPFEVVGSSLSFTFNGTIGSFKSWNSVICTQFSGLKEFSGI